MILSILGAAFLGVAGAQGAEPVQVPDLQDEIHRAINAQSEAEWRNALNALRVAGGEEQQELIRQLFRLAREATSTREAMAFGVIREALSIPDSAVVNALEPLLEEADDTRRAALRSVLSESEGHSSGGDSTLARAQPADATGPRTPWDHPDIQGIWDYRTLTPFERPEELGDKAFLTEEEAASLERETLARNELLLNRAAETTTASDQVDRREDGTPGFYNNFWLDRGTTAIATRRTSLIVDPANGRLPALTEPARSRAGSAEAERLAAVRRGRLPAASYTDLDAGDRCIQHAKTGPPISTGGYNNNIQIFQTPDHVVILAEQNHDARIVPLDGRPHVSPRVAQWMGDSRGHWDGETLVVETVHFNGKHDQIGRPLLSTGENLSLVERFTLMDRENLMYEYTVIDPTIWTSAWTAQHPMKRNPDLLYEFACHEGNYGMEGILAGSRVQEAAAATDR